MVQEETVTRRRGSESKGNTSGVDLGYWAHWQPTALRRLAS